MGSARATSHAGSRGSIRRTRLTCLILLLQLCSVLAGAQASGEGQFQKLTLQECLAVALQRNHSRPASQFAIAMAEAQHRQALAGYWPQVNAKAAVERTDEPLNFVFPASQMYIPSQTVNIPGGQATVTIPANAFGPGFPPTTVQLPVSYPGQSVTTPAQQFPIPAQNVKLMDPTTSTVTADVKWLLFDGGMRHGYGEQALAGVEAARAEAHRTDIDIADSVTRLYYGAVLARQLRQLGDDTLARMETTLQVTESLYKDGAGTVTKADYLDNKVMVETVRSMVAGLAGNEDSAKAALAYTMGLPWNATVEPVDEGVPFVADAATLNELVSYAYQFNPDWQRLAAGERAYAGAREAARSGYAPKLALTGEAHRFWNNYDGGISTPQNRAGWTVGAGMEIPLFDGFLTSARVAEAQARINKIKEEKALLHEGLGLELRDLVSKLQASEKTCKASREAMTAADEDADLTTRGYGAGLLTTEKVIRAQLQDALVTAQYFKAVYDHRALQSAIDAVAGKEAPSGARGK